MMYELLETMEECTCEVSLTNRLGLHARAAARLVETAQRFQSDVFLEMNGESVDGKSILDLLTLGAAFGSRLILRTRGVDAEAALTILAELIANKFGEE